jgi:DNA repair protein RecN (Recombination protein N)
MLTLLNISNIALIDDLQIEFDPGLNLLTGETGSGKSIIVDALGVLIGARFQSDLIKTGASRASIEGLFSVKRNIQLEEILKSAGIDAEPGDASEIIIRREVAAGGRNKIFINNQLATQSLLRELRPLLVDIHGQGDQQTLFDPNTHLELLDLFAGLLDLREKTADQFYHWVGIKRELDEQRKDDADRLQLIDILRFQIEELGRARLVVGEELGLEAEQRRLSNIEKLTALSTETFGIVYDDGDSALARVRQAARRIEELTQFEPKFSAYLEGLESARAVLEDLALALRDFGGGLEFSGARLEEVESRLAELGRLKRKYGGSVESALEHLARSEDRLKKIEGSDERERELRAELSSAKDAYLKLAVRLHEERLRASRRFEKAVVRDLKEVAMENARFEVRVAAPSESDLSDESNTGGFTASGIDRVEFYFSANLGEPVKPLAKVASGGEASRMMLVLKTVAGSTDFPRTIVFDEIDTGIGGRVSEAVGMKLKKLSATNQVMCVTHQSQIACFADNHLLVRKGAIRGRTAVTVERLDHQGRVEEIARMLTGSEITETARRHARELLKT